VLPEVRPNVALASMQHFARRLVTVLPDLRGTYAVAARGSDNRGDGSQQSPAQRVPMHRADIAFSESETSKRSCSCFAQIRAARLGSGRLLWPRAGAGRAIALVSMDAELGLALGVRNGAG
jgi:hypothetical protein